MGTGWYRKTLSVTQCHWYIFSSIWESGYSPSFSLWHMHVVRLGSQLDRLKIWIKFNFKDIPSQMKQHQWVDDQCCTFEGSSISPANVASVNPCEQTLKLITATAGITKTKLKLRLANKSRGEYTWVWIPGKYYHSPAGARIGWFYATEPSKAHIKNEWRQRIMLLSRGVST